MRHGAEVEAVAETVVRYLAERAGVGVTGPRHTALLARVVQAMADAGTTSAEKFRRLLEDDADKLDELIVVLTVGESYFFREPAQMELLCRRVVPERADARGPGGVLRLWSAGCAGGQEPYTLAIMLEEARLSVGYHILATDLSAESLENARRGFYANWSLRALDDRRRRAYFRPEPGGFRIQPDLGRHITFRRHNLLDEDDRPPGDMDVVLCRNVLVYLTPAAVQEVGRRLVESLAPGGWLLTASTDPRLEGVEGLQTVLTREGTAYQRVMSDPPGGGTAPVEPMAPARSGPPRRGRPSRTEPARRARAVPARRRSDPVPARRRFDPVPADGPAGGDPLEPARHALNQGDHELAARRAAELAAEATDGDAHAVLVRALGSAGSHAAAAGAAAEGVARFPLHVELRLLQAMVLLESDMPHEAAATAKAALYLDGNLVMAHLTLARAEQARGDTVAARRSYRNAVALLEGMPPDQPVAMSDGETAGRLAGLARAGHGLVEHREARAAKP